MSNFKRWITQGPILAAILGFLAINFVASVFHYRLDLTSDGLYSLSEGSNRIIEKIDDPVTIKYFFSSSAKNLPIQVKNYGRRVKEILQEFASRSDQITLEVYDPKPDSDEEEMATRLGLSGAQVNDGEPFYMGAAMLYLDQGAAR